MTDSSGSVVSTQSYDSFGVPSGPIASGYGFTGQSWDVETGLYYYRARYYDPTLGRFISRDPAEWGDGTMNWGAGNINWTTKDPARFVGGLNLYAYVDNDPQNKVDPTGLGPWDFAQCLARPFSDLLICLLEEVPRLRHGPLGDNTNGDGFDLFPPSGPEPSDLPPMCPNQETAAKKKYECNPCLCRLGDHTSSFGKTSHLQCVTYCQGYDEMICK